MKVSSVVKDYLTTASDGKNYNVTYYAPPMVLLLDFVLEVLEETKKSWDYSF